jgi:hypothetical protein
VHGRLAAETASALESLGRQQNLVQEGCGRDVMAVEQRPAPGAVGVQPSALVVQPRAGVVQPRAVVLHSHSVRRQR